MPGESDINMTIVEETPINIALTDVGNESGANSADEVSFDDTVISEASQGTITGDNVQEITDAMVISFVNTLTAIFGQLNTIITDINSLESDVDAIDNVINTTELLNLEDRTHYAVVGGGSEADYDIDGFILPNQGDFPDGGFDIYCEWIPIWGFTTVPDQYAFGEVFTITDAESDGGDMLEIALVFKGNQAKPFLEFTAEGQPGEEPRIVSGYSTPNLYLVQTRYTHDPVSGVTKIWRKVREGETAQEEAFECGWIATDIRDQEGAYPLKSGVTEPWHIGIGGGKRLISRVIVNDFSGSPMADFDASNATDDNTVADPIAGDDWVGSADTKIIQSTDFAERWLKGIESPVTSVNSQVGDVVLDKEDIGLSQADNTSDLNKPVSTATQSALDAKENSSNKDVDGTLAANSDTKYPSQKAVKTYVDGKAPIAKWREMINLVLYPHDANNGSVLSIQNSGAFLGGYTQLSATVYGTEYFEWQRIPLEAGTYTIILVHNTHAAGGIAGISLDGVSLGTVDHYTSGGAASMTTLATGVVVAAGLHTVRIAGTGTKNPSSSNYQLRDTAVIFRRTA